MQDAAGSFDQFKGSEWSINKRLVANLLSEGGTIIWRIFMDNELGIKKGDSGNIFTHNKWRWLINRYNFICIDNYLFRDDTG